jgi:hypothetical protein
MSPSSARDKKVDKYNYPPDGCTDLLNLDRIRDLGAPMVSIGGAGTSDGIFLAGVIAAFLA